MGNRPSKLNGQPATRATTMKVRRGKFSGTVGNEVYVNTKHGQVVRSRPRRTPRVTLDRERARANLGGVASLWRTLSNQRFAAWAVAARKEGMLPYRFFCQINGTLAAYGQPRLLDPPKRERLRPNPVEALEIRNRRGVITLRLRVPEAARRVHLCVRGAMVQPGHLGTPEQRRPPGPAAPGGAGLERDHGPLRQQVRPAPARFAGLHLHAAGHQRPERRPQADLRRCAPAGEVTARP